MVSTSFIITLLLLLPKIMPFDLLNILPNDILTKPTQTPTGLKINIPKDGYDGKKVVKPDIINEFDGWATSTFIMITGLDEVKVDYKYIAKTHPKNIPLFNQDVNQEATDYENLVNGFASHMSIGRSLENDSPSLIIDAESLELVGHFVEEDMSGAANIFMPAYPTDYDEVLTSKKDDGKTKQKQILLIRPEKRLKSRHRYIVVLRRLKNFNGKFISSPAEFAAVRDGATVNTEEGLLWKNHFEKRRIFETVLKTGLFQSVDEIFLAWDFTTASLISSTEHLRYMRDDGETQVRETGYRYNVKKFIDDYSEYIYRKVEGTFMVPLYIESFEPKVSNHLKRPSFASSYAESRRPDSKGEWAEVRFVIWIPRSLVRTEGKKFVGTGEGSLMQYGHGLFDSIDELEQRFLHKIAFEQKSILFGTDWIGLARTDLANLVATIWSDVSEISSMPERTSQGILNQLMLMNVLRYGSMFDDPKVFLIGDESVVDMDTTFSVHKVKHAYYFGISLGGIMGTIYSSLSKETQISTLGVPGGPFSLLFQRNTATYIIFTYLLRFHLRTSISRARALFFVQHYWQISDPITYTEVLEQGNYLGEDGSLRLMSEGKKKLLIQWGPTDGLVSSVGTMYLLRSLNAYSYQNDPYEVYYRDLLGYMVYNTQERRIQNGIDNATRLKVLRKEKQATVLHVASAFHYKKTFWASPFHNVAFPIYDAIKENTHDYPRVEFSAHEQMKLFVQNFKDGNNCDDDNWVSEACVGGCWNLDFPRNNFWMSPEDRKHFWSRIFLKNHRRHHK